LQDALAKSAGFFEHRKYLPQERFSVDLQQDQVLDEHQAAGKYLPVPWGGQVLARCVVAQTYRETL
jgi:hypothetical protein